MCGFPPHQASHAPTPAAYATIKLNSDAIYPEIASHRLRTQSHKTDPIFRCRCQSQILCLWLTDYRSEVPRTASLGSINLLEHSQNSEKQFTYWIPGLLHTMWEDMNQQPDEDVHRVKSSTKEHLPPWSLRPHWMACGCILISIIHHFRSLWRPLLPGTID